MSVKKSTQEQPQMFIDQYATHNPYWNSSLFNEVFLRNDLPKKYAHLWENDEIGPFYDFYNGFIELVQDLEDEDFKSWKETDTINNWIVKVMRLLGWANNCTTNQQSFSSEVSFTIQEDGAPKTYRPDLLYFNDPAHKKYVTKEKNATNRLREACDKNTGVIMPLEAKYWDRLEEYRGGDALGDKKRNNNKNDDNTRSLSPDDQILKYVSILKKDFGILTDGKTWRLLHRELSQGAVKRCFEFDLGNLVHLVKEGIDVGTNFQELMHYAKYFYLFFSKDSHQQESAGMPFVYEVLEYSKKYASKIEEDLRKRFIVAMGYACNAVMKSMENAGEEIDLDLVRNVAESHLFNILFFKSCEVRKILPIHKAPYLKLSLTEVIESIDYMRFDPEKDLDFYLPLFKKAFKGLSDWNGTDLYDRFMRLYKIVHKGASVKDDFGFEIIGFRESVFEEEEWRFAKDHKIDNESMALILFTLHFTESEFNERKYQQIPYSYFTPRQLGSIYESFLEFKLEKAESDMAFVKGQWKKKKITSKHIKKLDLDKNLIVKKGELFFTPDNNERKMSGAYYTPDYIVDYIVKSTIGPLTKGKTSQDILKLNVCDPAMGSGHFLSSALDFITTIYREQLQDESEDDIRESLEASTRKVLDRCIFGIDINSRAVKLAKMSLWLTSAYPEQKLERLDDQLFCEDTLLSDTSFLPDNMSAFIGNPPWLAKRQELFDSKELEYINENYRSAKGFKKNLFTLFLEKTCQMASNNCPINFVLPNRLLDTPSYSATREVAFKQYKEIKITKMPNGCFEGVTASCITLHLVGNKDSEIEVSELTEDSSNSSFLYNYLHEDLGKDFKVNINKNVKYASFVEKMNKISIETKEIFFCHVGMMVKNNKEEFSLTKSKTKNIKIVKGHCLGKINVEKTYYFNPNDVTIFGGTKRKEKHSAVPKMLIRKTGDYILCSTNFSGDPIYAEQSVYLVIPRKIIRQENLQAISIYYNTSIPTLYFRNELITNPDSYPYIQQYDLEKIPIPRSIVEDKVFAKKIIAKFDSVKGDYDKKLDAVEKLLVDSLGLSIEKEKKAA